MHARVTRSRTTPEKIDEVIAWFERTALPRAESLRGFEGALELLDRETGAGLTVTFWESAEALAASEAAAAGIRSEGVSALDFEVVGVERYDVTTSTLWPEPNGVRPVRPHEV